MPDQTEPSDNSVFGAKVSDGWIASLYSFTNGLDTARDINQNGVRGKSPITLAYQVMQMFQVMGKTNSDVTQKMFGRFAGSGLVVLGGMLTYAFWPSGAVFKNPTAEVSVAKAAATVANTVSTPTSSTPVTTVASTKVSPVTPLSKTVVTSAQSLTPTTALLTSGVQATRTVVVGKNPTDYALVTSEAVDRDYNLAVNGQLGTVKNVTYLSLAN